MELVLGYTFIFSTIIIGIIYLISIFAPGIIQDRWTRIFMFILVVLLIISAYLID